MGLSKRGKVGLGVLTGAAIFAFLVPFYFGPIGVPALSDKATPVTSAMVEGNKGNADWWRSAVNVILLAEDDVALANIHYRVGDGTEQVVAVPAGKMHSTSFSIEVDGRHSLQFWSEDRAGNREEPRSLGLKIDTVAPTISFGMRDEYIQTENLTIEFSAADEQSDVSYSARLDDERDVSRGESIQADNLAHGPHSVRVMAYDEAGNAEALSEEFRVKKLLGLITDHGENGRINNSGIVNSLLVKADHAFEKVESGKVMVGIHKLHALENHLEAQLGKHIDAAAAEELLALTRAVMVSLTSNA